MYIRNGIKTNIRSRGRTALFFALIFMLTVVMTAAAGVRGYCVSAIEKCDGEFRSVALIEYLGAEYPSPDEADADARAAFGELDLGAVGSVKGVKTVSPYARSVFYFDGFIQQKRNALYKDLGVVVISGIGDPHYSEWFKTVRSSDLKGDEEVVSYITVDSDWMFAIDGEEVPPGTELATVRYVDYSKVFYYSSRISYSFYSSAGKSEMLVNLLPGSSGFVPEPGKSYVMQGVFLGKNSSLGPHNGRENFEINKVEDGAPLYEEFDGLDTVSQPFLDAADKFLRANNYVFAEYAYDIRDLLVFQQGELYLNDGAFPEPGDEGGCVVSADLAKQLGLKVGDVVTGELLSSDPSNVYDLSPAGEDRDFHVRGIVKESNDYTGRIWAVGKGGGAPLYGYTLATVSLENRYAEDAVETLRGVLPDNTRVSLFDQGYGETVKPFRSIASAASDILFVCAAGAAASLTLFAFVFIGRQSYSVKIMISLGTPRKKIALWLLSGAMMISGTAALLGGTAGWIALPKVYELVASGTDFASSARRYSETSLGVTHTVTAETGFSPLPVAVCAAAVILFSLVLCVVFLRYAHKGATPKRGVTRVRVPVGRTSAALHGSARFAFLSVRRGGRGSLVVPAVCFALTAVIIVLGGVYSGWQDQLDRAYEETEIRGHAVSTDGRYYSGLLIDINHVRTLKKAEGVGSVWVSYSSKYYVPGEEPKTGSSGFGQERLNDWKLSGSDVVSLNDLHAAKDFFYKEPVVKWLEGWDEGFLAEYECAQFKDWRAYGKDGAIPAVLSERFMEEHGIALGGEYSVMRTEETEGGHVFDYPMTVRAVGSYKQIGGKANIYVPLTCTVPLDALADDYDPSLHNKRDGWGNVISEDYYLYERVYFSSCRFTVSSANALETLRASLADHGFSRVGRLGMIRTTIVLEDGSFIKLTETLGRYISMGKAMMALIAAVVMLIGFIVSWLMVNGRKREFALMRGLGAKKGRIFFSFFLEQAALCAAGCAAGCLVLSITGAFSLLQLAAVGVFILLYLAGSVISTAIIGRTKLMELFAVRE